MPEWKSVALDGDEPADSPGAGGQDGPDAGGPSPDEFALKWGTEVQPVTIERIAAVLEGDGLPVAISEFAAATQVEEGNFQIHREPADCPWAQVELRLLVQGAELADLDSIANDWNAAHLQPTVFPVPEAGQPLPVAAQPLLRRRGHVGPSDPRDDPPRSRRRPVVGARTRPSRRGRDGRSLR